MSIWKQLALSVIVLVVAAAAWVTYFPGAPEILASWGIDWAQASADEAADKTGSTDKPGDKDGQRNRSAQPAPVITANVTPCHDQRQAVGDRHRPRQQFGCRDTLFVRHADRDRGDARDAGSKPAASLRGSIRIRKRSPSTAPRSRSAMPKSKRDRMTLLKTSNTASTVQVTGRRDRRRECAAGTARRRTGAEAPLDPLADCRHRRHRARSRPATRSPIRPRWRWSTTAPRSSSISGCPSASPERSRSATRWPRRRSRGRRRSMKAR